MLTCLSNNNFNWSCSATSCTIIYMLLRYCNKEFSVQLSINLSGFYWNYVMPAALSCICCSGSTYNWWETARKMQSRPPPTSNSLKLKWFNLCCNTTLSGTVIAVLFWSSPGLSYISPDSNNFIWDMSYCLSRKYFILQLAHWLFYSTAWKKVHFCALFMN